MLGRGAGVALTITNGEIEMKAHELARQLLAGPDVEVMALDPESPDYPLHINGVKEQNAMFCECDDWDEDSDDNGHQVVTLKIDTTDGILEE
jgi:hypothetical protein